MVMVIVLPAFVKGAGFGMNLPHQKPLLFEVPEIAIYRRRVQRGNETPSVSDDFRNL